MLAMPSAPPYTGIGSRNPGSSSHSHSHSRLTQCHYSTKSSQEDPGLQSSWRWSRSQLMTIYPMPPSRHGSAPHHRDVESQPCGSRRRYRTACLPGDHCEGITTRRARCYMKVVPPGDPGPGPEEPISSPKYLPGGLSPVQ